MCAAASYDGNFSNSSLVFQKAELGSHRPPRNQWMMIFILFCPGGATEVSGLASTATIRPEPPLTLPGQARTHVDNHGLRCARR